MAHPPARWSWAGLAAWLAWACLSLLLAAGLLFGPDLANAAWDRGVHVTPAQAAAHAALVASGYSHHHHGPSSVRPAVDAAGASTGATATLEQPGSAPTWGAPPTQADQPGAVSCPADRACLILPPDESRPAEVSLSPLTPPPRLF